ncbi:BspA family leucine-rich repeat surface protein [Lactococcus petauri]|uniref:BspA family leucine-rich repeat surface protein n=1 Tax=Lactococcus petauri TaxID=1940789 RepID=UPI003853F234
MKQYIGNRFIERKRKIGLLGFLTVLVLGVTFLGLAIPKIMAGDTQVSDLILQGESKEKSIVLTVRDKHSEDTKIVLPLPEGITYTSNSNPNIGVTYDELSKQLVIDWVEGEAKQVQLQLEAKQVGQYSFVAQTVRDGKTVNSEIEMVHINKEAVMVDDSMSDLEEEQSKDSDALSTETNEESGDTGKKAQRVKVRAASGVDGTVQWTLDDSGTLTFHSGEFAESPKDVQREWQTFSSDIKKIIFNGQVKAPINSNKLFSGFTQLKEFENLTFLDTSQVTDMSYMFWNSRGLTALDLSSFNTSKVFTMSAMFLELENLTTLNLSNFDTSNVTTMSAMFEFVALKTLDLSHFNTSKVTDMSYMFYGSSELSALNLTNFDTRQVVNMKAMFTFVGGLSELDVSSFDTSNVTNMSNMFNGVAGINELDLSKFNTNKVVTMANMFDGCISLKKLDISTFDTSNVTDMSEMFFDVRILEKLDMTSFDMGRVIKSDFMFQHMNNLRELRLGNMVKFSSKEDLSDRAPTATTTGKWQNIGSGTIENPIGKYIFTSTELLENYEGREMADTYVMQPIISPLLTQEIESQTQAVDGNTYAGDNLNYSIKIGNKVSNPNAFVKAVNLQITIPQSFDLNQESIEVKTVKGDKLEKISTEFSDNKLRISGSSLEVLTTEEVIIKYNVKSSKAGEYTTQSTVEYADGAEIFQNPVTTVHKVNIKSIPEETTETSLLPEDISKYSEDHEEFPYLTTLVKNDKTSMIFTLKNLDTTRNKTLSNVDIWFNISNFDEMLEVDKDTFYIKKNSSNDWEKIDSSQIDDSGKMGSKQYSIAGLNLSLSKNEQVKVKFSMMAKTNFTPQKQAITTQGTLLESGIFSSTNSLSAKYGELRFEKVPELLTFETSKISNRTKEIKRKDDGWNLTVEDTRLQKKNWRVAVELSDPFKDTYGNEAKGDLLFFRNALGEKQWINNNGTTVFDGTSSEEDYYKVAWEKDKGLLLEVAPGEVKVGNYQSTLNWTLVDAPA